MVVKRRRYPLPSLDSLVFFLLPCSAFLTLSSSYRLRSRRFSLEMAADGEQPSTRPLPSSLIEDITLMRQMHAFSLAPSASASASASTRPADDDSRVNLLLEELCRHEFGFDLGEFKQSLSLQAQELQLSLFQFCEEVLSTHDPAQRREVAHTFITGTAKITERATERSNRMLAEMQSTFIKNIQIENDKLCKEVGQLQDKVSELTEALQISELEKEDIEANAQSIYEEEKAMLREELQACQICLRNPRNVIIVPCLHAQYCKDCLERANQNNNTCPTCRGIIRGMLPYIA